LTLLPTLEAYDVYFIHLSLTGSLSGTRNIQNLVLHSIWTDRNSCYMDMKQEHWSSFLR